MIGSTTSYAVCYASDAFVATVNQSHFICGLSEWGVTKMVLVRVYLSGGVAFAYEYDR